MFFRFLFALLVVGMPVVAEPVALKDGLGQGLLFKFRGNCYVVFPAHVQPTGRALNLFTASPQAGGSAIIYLRRTETDIALGIVSGGARERCGHEFAKLPQDVSPILSNSRLATLERVNPQGGFERLRMQINDLGWEKPPLSEGVVSGLYSYVHASTAEGETREVFEGNSGAFLYVDDTPVGMVVSAPDAKSVKALRIEEITPLISRWLKSGSLGALQPQASQTEWDQEGIEYQVTEWSGLLVDADAPPTGPSSGGAPFRVVPHDNGVSLVLELSRKEALRVSEVVLVGAIDQGTYASPRGVKISVDRGRPGQTNFQEYATIEMAPNQPQTVPVNTFARQLRIEVTSSWAPGLPIEISSVQVVAMD